MSNFDNLIKSIIKWTENITYGEMKEITKDRMKMNLLETLYGELSKTLNDIEIIEKEENIRKVLIISKNRYQLK